MIFLALAYELNSLAFKSTDRNTSDPGYVYDMPCEQMSYV